MGVPAFFQWLRERYPTMMHEVMEGDSLDRAYANAEAEGRDAVQICDHLYLDLNGIVHPCCHPEDGQEQPKDEDEMLRRIEHHLDRLIELMRPRAFVYFALDGVRRAARVRGVFFDARRSERTGRGVGTRMIPWGTEDARGSTPGPRAPAPAPIRRRREPQVAPRAKMNQQRTRRYVAAQERAEAARVDDEVRAELAADGVDVPPKPDAKWDHNVITPGTEFMRKLATFLRAYCARRCAKHARWAKLSFCISDATVPGEGEHKIVSYVRGLRQQPGYDPKTRHCIVGEDADLIMLRRAARKLLRRRTRSAERKLDAPRRRVAATAAGASWMVRGADGGARVWVRGARPVGRGAGRSRSTRRTSASCGSA